LPKKNALRNSVTFSKKIDTPLIERNFGIEILVDDTAMLPVELHQKFPYLMDMFWKLFVPSLLRKKCDLIIDAYSNVLSPFVDVSYLHSFRHIGILTQENEVKPPFLHPSQMLNLLIQKTLSSDPQRLILANSNFSAQGIRELLGIKPLVIYPPVSTSVFNSFLRISKEKIVITISRFSFEKSLELLPKIAHKIDARFVIIGSVYDQMTLAGYRKMMERIKQYGIEDKVKVFANLPFSEKVALLGRSKVYLHTMKFEDFGISIVEGMAASCIPVVHNSGGPKEYVPEEWLYNDPESASQKVEEALVKWTPEIGNQMSNIAARFSQAMFREKFSTRFKEYLASSYE